MGALCRPQCVHCVCMHAQPFQHRSSCTSHPLLHWRVPPSPCRAQVQPKAEQLPDAACVAVTQLHARVQLHMHARAHLHSRLPPIHSRPDAHVSLAGDHTHQWQRNPTQGHRAGRLVQRAASGGHVSFLSAYRHVSCLSAGHTWLAPHQTVKPHHAPHIDTAALWCATPLPLWCASVWCVALWCATPANMEQKKERGGCARGRIWLRQVRHERRH